MEIIENKKINLKLLVARTLQKYKQRGKSEKLKQADYQQKQDELKSKLIQLALQVKKKKSLNRQTRQNTRCQEEYNQNQKRMHTFNSYNKPQINNYQLSDCTNSEFFNENQKNFLNFQLVQSLKTYSLADLQQINKKCFYQKKVLTEALENNIKKNLLQKNIKSVSYSKSIQQENQLQIQTRSAVKLPNLEQKNWKMQKQCYLGNFDYDYTKQKVYDQIQKIIQLPIQGEKILFKKQIERQFNQKKFQHNIFETQLKELIGNLPKNMGTENKNQSLPFQQYKKKFINNQNEQFTIFKSQRPVIIQ